MEVEKNIDQQLKSASKYSGEVKTAGPYDRVYKEECVYSYASPLSPDGLYVNLKTFQGVGQQYLGLDVQKSGSHLYLNMIWEKVPLSEEELNEQQKQPSKLGIGTLGGFDVGKKDYNIIKHDFLYVYPEDFKISLPNNQLPQQIIEAVQAIQDHSGRAVEQQVGWEDERVVSKYAKDLIQLPADRKISMDPRDWKCDESGENTNLWLNLSDGFIGSGQRHWDGSGGNGAALRHYEETGKQFPLVVKLGTITPNGGDVFSYAPDENDMMIDPYLERHLEHWGLDMRRMHKTDKTMDELQIEYNMNYDFSKFLEGGDELTLNYGPGRVGLKNLGNSCYINSVMQAVFNIDEVNDKYIKAAQDYYHLLSTDPGQDFIAQFMKMDIGMTKAETLQSEDSQIQKASGVETKDKLEDQYSISPHMFKYVAGKSYPAFQTNQQQDALEFLQWLLEQVSREETKQKNVLGQQFLSSVPTANLFRFQIQHKIQDLESMYVRYITENTNVLDLSIPMEAAENLHEVQEYQQNELKRQKIQDQGTDLKNNGKLEQQGGSIKAKEEPQVVARVPFKACLEQLTSPEVMTDYYSAILKKQTTAHKTVKLKTFPPYLIIQLRRYQIDPYTQDQKKNDALVQFPDIIDLEDLRAHTPPQDEKLQPDDNQDEQEQYNQQIVEQLLNMGFSENACKKASIAVQNKNAEEATMWLLGNQDDPTINDPIVKPKKEDKEVSQESIGMLQAMGFSPEQGKAALIACDGNLERAGDWLFSRMDNLDQSVAEVLNKVKDKDAPQEAQVQLLDGKGQYELQAVVLHKGRNLSSGHYVCCVKKDDGQWYLFNDEKVGVLKQPLSDQGYIYFYKRVEST